MKVLQPSDDLTFEVEILDKKREKIDLSYFERLDFTVFTSDENIPAQYHMEDLIDDCYLNISSDVIQSLEDGQISIKMSYSYINESFNDLSYDDSVIKSTRYVKRSL